MDRQTASRQIERMVQAIEDGKFPAKIRELHVFGSYARGALDPGDLDLIVIHEDVSEMLKSMQAELIEKHGESFLCWPRGQWPERKFETTMRKVMRRPGEKMDILFGTSMEKLDLIGNIVANSPRVLIWSETDRDWQGKLESIKPDPNAGRHERPHFANLKRFNDYRHTMENVTEAVSQGFLKLTRIDAASVEPSLNPLYQDRYDWWIKCKVMGMESMKLLLHGMWWMQKQRGQALQLPCPPRHDGVMTSEDRKYAVHFGKPSLYSVYQVCLGDHRLVTLCLIPHFKRNEPNELFVFERGTRRDQKEMEKIMDRQ